MANGFVGWLGAGVLLGVGTAMVYPTLLASVGDVAHPSWRGSAVGVYRLWRDSGYAVGGVMAGTLADAFGMRAAIGGGGGSDGLVGPSCGLTNAGDVGAIRLGKLYLGRAFP